MGGAHSVSGKDAHLKASVRRHMPWGGGVPVRLVNKTRGVIREFPQLDCLRRGVGGGKKRFYEDVSFPST